MQAYGKEFTVPGTQQKDKTCANGLSGVEDQVLFEWVFTIYVNMFAVFRLESPPTRSQRFYNKLNIF